MIHLFYNKKKKCEEQNIGVFTALQRNVLVLVLGIYILGETIKTQKTQGVSISMGLFV